MRIISFLFLALFVLGQAQAKTVNCADSGQCTSQGLSALISGSGVAENDTVVVPPGTISWSARLVITKPITLQGGCSNSLDTAHGGTCTTPTILKDDVSRGGTTTTPGMIGVTMGATQSFRLTGFNFVPSVTVAGNAVGAIISLGGSSEKVRVDHCYFGQLYAGVNIDVTGTTHGVCDHCWFDCGQNIMAAAHNGGRTGHGWEAWEVPPQFGTNKFFFFEDNVSQNIGGSQGKALPDGTIGGKYVFRRNTVYSASFTWHGSEAAWQRGTRAVEVYQNQFYHDDPAHPGADGGKPGSPFTSANIRSGSILYHDNVYGGSWAHATSSINDVIGLKVFRQIWNGPNWYGVGTSDYDKCVTENASGVSDGAWVFGHKQHAFFIGGCIPPTGAVGQPTNKAYFTTPSPPWTTNQWVTPAGQVPVYHAAIINAGAPNYHAHGNIISSGPDWIMIDPENAGHEGKTAGFQGSGNTTVGIYKVYAILDQPGGGKGVSMGSGVAPDTGRTFYPENTVTEPCYAWNNFNGTTAYRFFSNSPTILNGTDYINLTVGSTPDMTTNPLVAPSAVSTMYNTTLNGVPYTKTYDYPHPCTLDILTCSSALSAPSFVNGASDTTTAVVGTAFNYDITAVGNPVPTMTSASGWPGGVGFTDAGGGVGKLSGTPTGTPSTTTKTITAHNTQTPDATQSFTLKVNAAATGVTPSFTSGTTANFVDGTNDSFSITATGQPVPAITQTSGTIPPGLSFAAPSLGSATISGTPTSANGTGVDIGVHAASTSGTADQTIKVIVAPSPTPTPTPGGVPTPAPLIVSP